MGEPLALKRLVLNGEERHSAAGDLAALLRELDIAPAAVVAEVNGVIVPQADFAATPLAAGDRVELVRFVGGG